LAAWCLEGWKGGDRTVVLALGSPYSILNFPAVRSYLCLYNWVPTSEKAAVKGAVRRDCDSWEAAGDAAGVAKRGEGMEREVAP